MSTPQELRPSRARAGRLRRLLVAATAMSTALAATIAGATPVHAAASAGVTTYGSIPAMIADNPDAFWAGTPTAAGRGDLVPEAVKGGTSGAPNVKASSASTNTPGGADATYAFNRQRNESLANNTSTSWATNSAADHGNAAATTYGLAVDLGAATAFDTVVIYGGKSGTAAYKDTEVGAITLETSSSADAWAALAPNVAGAQNWPLAGAAGWETFAAPGTADGASRVFVFRTAQPVTAQFLRVNLAKGATGAQTYVNAFEVYDSTRPPVVTPEPPVLAGPAQGRYEAGVSAPPVVAFEPHGATLASVTRNGEAVASEHYAAAADGDRLDVTLVASYLAGLVTDAPADHTFAFTFSDGTTLEYTLTVAPTSGFRQGSFVYFTDFFNEAGKQNNSLGLAPGYDFGEEPSPAQGGTDVDGKTPARAGAGLIRPSVVRSSLDEGSNADLATVTGSSWAIDASGDASLESPKINHFFDGVRYASPGTVVGTAWQTNGATDHGAFKQTPFGAAMKLDGETMVDTIVIYAGRKGVSTFSHDPSITNYGWVTGVSVSTSTNDADWAQLNKSQAPGPAGDWTTPAQGAWSAFGTTLPIKQGPAGDVVNTGTPSQTNTKGGPAERVFVFHSLTPIPAKYLKVDFERAENPNAPGKALQAQFGYSFEAYNTAEPVVSPTAVEYNTKKPDPVTASVYTAGGELTSVADARRTLVAGTDYTTAPASSGATTLTFTRAYLDTLPAGETRLTLTVGSKALALTLTKVTPQDPSLDASAGSYDKTAPGSLPSVGLNTPGGNRLTGVTLGGQPVDPAHYTVENGRLTFARAWLDGLSVGVHELSLAFAWGDTATLPYTLTVTQSAGAFLEQSSGWYNRVFPTTPHTLGVDFGAAGGYGFGSVAGLTAGRDYAVSDAGSGRGTLTFSADYLAALPKGEHDVSVVFTKAGAADVALTYTIKVQPGSSIDYSIWQIESQENNGSNLSKTYPSSQLVARDYTPWWYGDTAGEYDYFMTSSTGYRTANAANSRTELRELTPNADQQAWWNHDGFHQLTGTYKVEYVDRLRDSGKVAIAQLKSNGSQAEIFVDKNFAFSTIGVTATGVSPKVDGAAKSTAAGTPFGLKVDVVDGTARMFVDGDLVFTQELGEYTDNFYFKAGNYDQNTPDVADPDPNEPNSLVGVSGLTALHNPIRGRLVGADGKPWANQTLTYSLVDAPSQVADTYGRTIAGLTTTTDAEGYYTIANVPNGRVGFAGGTTPNSVSRTAKVEIELPTVPDASPRLTGDDLGALADGKLVVDAVPAAGITDWRTLKTVDYTAPDTVAPTVTVKPESAGRDGVYRTVSFKLFDEGRIDKLTLNGVEKDLTDNAWSDLNGVTPGVFGAREGANELKVYDVAGNVTTMTFVLDVTGPSITVKPEGSHQIGGGRYRVVSFKLHDAYKVDRLTLNGVAKDLTDAEWSDLNGVSKGVFGAVKGDNELIVYDVAGNATTLAFRLD